MSNNLKGIILAAITAILWGFLAIALKAANADVDPVTIVWFRFALAFVLLSGYHAFRKPKELRILTNPPLLLVVSAICLAANYLGYMQGIHYTTPGNAQVIIQTGPILLGAYGILFFRERLSLMQIVGFSVAIVGFILFYRQQLSTIVGPEEAYNTGVWWIIFAATAWSGYGALQKLLVRKFPAQTLNMFLYGLPALIFIPWVDFSSLASLHTTSWLLMAFLGLNTLVAYGTLGAAFKYIEANKISIIITLNPIITFAAMALFTTLNVSWINPENISIMGVLGGVLVLAGAILVISKRKRK